MGTAEGNVDRNRRLQAEWYGEPLGDRFRWLLERLGISQANLAQVVGLSPPMLSQLMSGRRAKISNPVVLNRLLAVEELARDPDFGTLTRDAIGERLSRIHAESATTSSGMRMTTPPVRTAAEEPARALQSLLRAVASAAEIEAAASLLDAGFPDLAAVLRVYGNGRTADAQAHFAHTLGTP
ncbi:helix-turn-helix domain-containing protein [Actinomadura alba]|uniref:Helix-turn-helix transcriptional regulator n=1 Tax=Actinomadura alba TaxID=406431 RepID=A0ABR7LRH3_9ACTN|nr:helix-turn-helix transcriptional regulator [Actinomadura alba]MBC6467379.1 helix-turn-helix transcriptional regulator [Actinomadura alba]